MKGRRELSPTETNLCKTLNLCQPSQCRSLTFQLRLESKRDHLPYLLSRACDSQDALRMVPGEETLSRKVKDLPDSAAAVPLLAGLSLDASAMVGGLQNYFI